MLNERLSASWAYNDVDLKRPYSVVRTSKVVFDVIRFPNVLCTAVQKTIRKYFIHRGVYSIVEILNAHDIK